MNKVIEKNLDYLYQRREQLDHDRFELSNSLDKYIFTASTGVLALIVGFKGSLCNIGYIYLLWGAIILLLLCIGVTLLSIYFSISAYEKQMAITDNEIKDLQDEKEQITRHNNWNKVVKYTSIISGILFFLGTLLATIFYCLNIQ